MKLICHYYQVVNAKDWHKPECSHCLVATMKIQCKDYVQFVDE